MYNYFLTCTHISPTHMEIWTTQHPTVAAAQDYGERQQRFHLSREEGQSNRFFYEIHPAAPFHSNFHQQENTASSP